MKPKTDRVGLKFRWRLWRLGVDARPAKTGVAGAFVVAGLLVALSGAGIAKPVISMDSSQWNVYNLTPGFHISKPMQTAGGGVSFDFLSSDAGFTAYLLNHFSGDLTGMTVTAKIVVSAPGATFVYRQRSGCGAPPGVGLPSVRLEFQTTTSGGYDNTSYWWSNTAGGDHVLADSGGPISISAAFKPESWSDINGTFGDNPLIPGAFAAALTNAKQMGLSFGGGFCFANGVAVSSGTATFELVELSLSPTP